MADPENRNVSGATVDDDGVARGRYEWSSTPPSTGVVEVVATAADSDPTALAPLYGSLDPDGLDELVRSAGERPGDGLVVSFSYAGHEVTVRSDGSVTARPADGA